MADTTTAPNNKAVAFRGKPVREPSRVAKPKAPKTIRRTANRAIKRGLISEKAAKRHLGDA